MILEYPFDLLGCFAVAAGICFDDGWLVVAGVGLIGIGICKRRRTVGL